MFQSLNTKTTDPVTYSIKAITYYLTIYQATKMFKKNNNPTTTKEFSQKENHDNLVRLRNRKCNQIYIMLLVKHANHGLYQLSTKGSLR